MRIDLKATVPRSVPRCLSSLMALAVVALAGGACDDNPIGARYAPQAMIQDGNNHDGNEHFYWLRPLVKPPATFPGDFDPTVSPEIRICALLADLSGCDGADIATLGMNAGTESEVVRMEPGEQQYIVNWHTRRYGLDPAKHYRIRAYVGSAVLGIADIDVVDSGRQLKNVATAEYIPLLEGQPLLIKFRIEKGAVSGANVNAISAGGFHSCGLVPNGDAYCWGYNWYGQLGNGASENMPDGSDRSATPVKVALPAGVALREIRTGTYTTCGLATTGQAYCWGYGGTGSLGNGSFTTSQPMPVAVAGGHIFTTLSGAAYTTCGLEESGSAWCWGYDLYGQLGNDGIFANQSVPQAVAGGLAFKSVSAHSAHTCGVTIEGAAYCWGYREFGALGISHSDPDRTQQPTPEAVLGGHVFASVDAGGFHTCALKAGGDAWCWGQNELGGTGTGNYSTPSITFTPAPVVGGHTFTALTLGWAHSCGLTASGAAFCWGYNATGQVGLGTTSNPGPNMPSAVVGGFSFAQLDAGWHHTCGITTAGRAICWGDNQLRQIGDGTAAPVEPMPTPVGVGLVFRTP